MVPSMRDEDKDKFVQGIEKFIDTMQNETYTAVFIAQPVSKAELESKKRGYEELEREGFLYTVAGKGCFVAEKNLDLIREQKLKELEDHPDAAGELAAQCGVSASELMEMLRILLKEGEPHV